MKISELREKTDQELKALLLDLGEKTRSLRFSLSSKQVKNVKEYREIRKDMARILTLVAERNLTL